ncbi:uncharacterized protein LOC141909493 [Tubulanus polymorphus]|uniref:uncharacterized protein LOC141909493 n=1 Tax=Tubulanus polymorphus TaxID=672921 RepID=UPI003DA4D523
MDTAKGCCWKCDKPRDVKTCSRCKIAKYCTNQCLQADAAKHRIDCQYLGTDKNRPCDFCQQVKPSRMCSRCLEVGYCSKDCQRKDWPSHKQGCNEFKHNMLRDFRSGSGGITQYRPIQFYDLPWYWGNQAAVDWLQLPNKEGADYERDINVLSVGCGNLGNVLLTTANVPDAFRNKVNFVLVDFCPHIMARNVLFHYMITAAATEYQQRGPERGEDQTDKACRLMSQIMYSLRLSPDARNYLVAALETLVEMNEENADHILGGKFETLKQIWQKWKDLAFDDAAVEAMRSTRTDMMSTANEQNGIDHYLASIPKRYVKSCKQWFENGLFARTRDTDEREKMKFPNPTLTMMNPWLNESEDEELLRRILLNYYQQRPNYRDEMLYVVHFNCAAPHWWKYDDVRRHRDNDDIIDMFDAYFRHVLRRAIVNYRRINVTFIVDDYRQINKYIGDRKFDRIATSNVADYYKGLYELVDDMAPRLNRENNHSVLMTSLMNWPFRPVIIAAEEIAKMKARISKLFKGVTLKLEDDLEFQESNIDRWPAFLNYLRGMLQAHLKCRNVVKLNDVWKCRNGVRLARFDLFENSIVPFQRSQVKYAVNLPQKYERNLEFIVADSDDEM